MEDYPINKKGLLEKTIKKERSAVLIINTHSRKGQRFYKAALNKLTKQGISVVSSYPVRYPERLPKVVKEIINRGHKLIIVGGGDGTISSVVDFFAYQDVVLGILPLGTANSFARTLGIPMDLKGSVDVIVNGKVADVDLGKVGNDYFSNVVAIGFAATIARNISYRLKRSFGVLAYVLMGIKAFFSHRAFECTLTINEETFKIKTHQVVISNGGHFGILPLIPNVSPDDQELVVFVIDTENRWDMLKLWIAFLLKNLTSFSQARFFKTKEILIEAIPSQYVKVDGEITTKTPISITLAPEALKVMVPNNFKDI
ncbi:MAG: YegS/Rv2252/BmrU family lipid kinase [Desulfitobacterium hafniense]|nr:YegS/Rv2252/BmrU family lipid kinase [Desulfitobacterium hafniense]